MVSRKFFSHLLTGKWTVHRVISKDDSARIASAIAASEIGHSGELRVVIEGSRPLKGLLHPNSLRSRAHYIFSVERVWDTEKNNGVLLYLCLADRACEIVVDRGLAAVTTATTWRSIADRFVSSKKAVGLHLH